MKYKNKKKLKVICIIPARGGSKGIKEKNIKLLNGRPLIFYSINEALKLKKLFYKIHKKLYLNMSLACFFNSSK